MQSKAATVAEYLASLPADRRAAIEAVRKVLFEASYMVLDQGISPVTFSVGNTMKRVAVVVSSVMFFRNPVSALNWVGSGVAILGTYLYSVATDKAKEEAKKKKK